MGEIEDIKEIKLEDLEKESKEEKTEKEEVKKENEKKDNKKMKEKKKKHPFLRFIRGFLIFLIILIVAMAGAGFAFYTSKYGQMQVEEIDENNIGIDAEVDESLEATGYRNIVILGIDSRADDYGVGNRSDGIIIASYNSKTKAVKLTSVYRDTFVDVEERGKVKLDKVTHAYSYGQAEGRGSARRGRLPLPLYGY